MARRLIRFILRAILAITVTACGASRKPLKAPEPTPVYAPVITTWVEADCDTDADCEAKHACEEW